MTDPVPSYPEQGTMVLDDAVDSIIPSDLEYAGARVLYVHAHPDDETVVTGVSMAQLSRLGAQVSLLTMTRGERGEVIPEHLRHLEVGHPECTDDGSALGDYRVGELRAACAALGVSQQFFALDAPAYDPVAGVENSRQRYLDSGMSWAADGRAQPADDLSPAALTAAPQHEVAAHIAAAIRHVRPVAVVTYDDDGGYGHPDHIRTAQATIDAVAMARESGVGGAGWEVPLVWAIEGQFRAEDSRHQAYIQATPHDMASKRAALEAHATQLTLPSDTSELRFAFSNGVDQKISAVETFRLVGGAQAPEEPARSSFARPARDPLWQVSVPMSIGISVIAGILAGILGTGVHGNIARFHGVPLPWGVLVALALALSVSVWAGTTTRRVWAAAVPGVVAYGLSFAFAFLRPDSALIVLSPDSMIGLVGIVWFGGILVATLCAVVLVGRWRIKRVRGGTTLAI